MLLQQLRIDALHNALVETDVGALRIHLILLARRGENDGRRAWVTSGGASPHFSSVTYRFHLTPVVFFFFFRVITKKTNASNKEGFGSFRHDQLGTQHFFGGSHF